MTEYDVILADPPWHFQNQKRGAAQAHYSTMSNQAIAAMQIPAADNAVLFLWAVWPLLPEALMVINSWGFEYKTIGWVWTKAKRSGFGFHFGMGFYTRSNTEPCLFATKGNPGRPEDKAIQALIYAPVREHSRKPDDQYRKIEAMYPGRRYLELFARRKREGWDAWGNEVESDVEIQAG